MSIFPTRVLLATDGSSDAHLAGISAAELAKATGSELRVVHVAPLIAYARAVRTSESNEDARNVLAGEVDRLRDSGADVAEAHLKVGLPEEAIVALSEELGVGLIVMGSRGLGGVRRALMGSVSDSVVRHAHCPVMVVRGEALAFPTRILLATDGSEEANLAASTAVDLAGGTASELHVVHVEPMPMVYYESPGAMVVDAELEKLTEEAAEQEARARLEEQVRKVEEAGGKVVQAHARVGHPDAEIVGLAERIGAGLIAVGSRGRGPLRRALMGSVSDSVVRHASCPVLVVRPQLHTRR